ncbi:DUF6056 family protein [Pantoea sp. B623]|uniref:DUF6056 family protein n=1 Tax=Pantoea sp. B623 TaxID=2974561 RepID=UPI002167EAB2|nr:DUF6056 family protein [Pantoea sp. B623]MCS4496265.1 DUF6056 family protein [Pantoea sp. B623]
MRDSKSKDFVLFAWISFALFIAIVIMSPMAGEDYGLTRLFHDESFFQRISYAIGKSYNQINGWNARLGEQLAIIELSFPRWMSIVIYSLSFPVFSIVVAMACSKNDGSIWKLASIYCAGFMFIIWPGMEVFFWKTANSGYLQPMILTLLVVIPYSGRSNIEILSKRKLIFSLYLSICILAGLSFENVPFSLFVSLLILCVWEGRRKIINYLPVFFVFIGWLSLMAAPSTSARRAYYSSVIPVNKDLLVHYSNRFADVVFVFFSTSSVIFILSIISVIYLAKLKLFGKYHACLILSSVLVVGSMMASPYTEARGFLFSWCVMYSFICHASSKAFEKFELQKASVALLFLSTCFGIYTLCIYSTYGEKLKMRESEIIKSIGTDKCKKGYEIGIINDNHGYRYLNNRDEWYFYNMIGKTDYYGCYITNIK